VVWLVRFGFVAQRLFAPGPSAERMGKRAALLFFERLVMIRGIERLQLTAQALWAFEAFDWLQTFGADRKFRQGLSSGRL